MNQPVRAPAWWEHQACCPEEGVGVSGVHAGEAGGQERPQRHRMSCGLGAGGKIKDYSSSSEGSCLAVLGIPAVTFSVGL